MPCTGPPPGARSTSVPVARRRARHRCTRSSETCHSEHTHECANPSATASWTVFRTSSLASAGTLAGSGPLRPGRPSADHRQLSRLGLDRLGQLRDLHLGGLQLPVALLRRRPGALANAASAASFTARRIPMTVDTSTYHLRAASAWVTSPVVTCKKIPHSVSADSLVGHRRAFGSVIDCSSQLDRGDNQFWLISPWTLRAEVRRRTARTRASLPRLVVSRSQRVQFPARD
jgi:hypothetical protein